MHGRTVHVPGMTTVAAPQLFSSKPSVSADPEPYVGWSGRRYGQDRVAWASVHDRPVVVDPRAEYERTPVNPPGAILTRFRHEARTLGVRCATGRWLADFETRTAQATEAERAHAHRVIVRLASAA